MERESGRRRGGELEYCSRRHMMLYAHLKTAKRGHDVSHFSTRSATAKPLIRGEVNLTETPTPRHMCFERFMVRSPQAVPGSEPKCQERTGRLG